MLCDAIALVSNHHVEYVSLTHHILPLTIPSKYHTVLHTSPQESLHQLDPGKPILSMPLPLISGISPKDVTASPSSTTISESGISTSFHQTDNLAVRAHTSAGFLATRKITIRSDPALLTCFDAADKQLYDLWVPSA